MSYAERFQDQPGSPSAETVLTQVHAMLSVPEWDNQTIERIAELVETWRPLTDESDV